MTVETLAALLVARTHDPRPGLLFEDRTWTWQAHIAECRRYATWLSTCVDAVSAGVGGAAEGGRLHVGVLLDNVPETVFLIGGAALSGQVVVALNPTRSPVELARDAQATDVGLIVWDEPYGAAARAVAESLGVRCLSLADLATELPPLAPPEHPALAAQPASPGQPTSPAQPTSSVPPTSSTVPEGAAGPGAVEEARAGVVPSGSAGVAPPGGRREAGDLVMLIFTSGTSGRPRAVRVTQRKIATPGLSLAALLTPEDVVYCAMPLFHSGAIMAAYAPAAASGAALVLRRKFSASGVLPDVRRYGCTYLHYVGKALSYVLATPEDPGDADNSLKVAFGNEGSATATRRFGRRFGCLVIDAFGSTETAIAITPDPAGPPGCLGRLPETVEIRDPFTGERCPPAVIEDGRLLNADEAIGELVNVGGLGLFDGYYRDPEADAERIRQGAFWSGDLAYADKSGYVFFAGRGTERLRVDGENLAVAPIEAIVREAPGVLEAAVYPVPDAAAGDQVMAAVVPSAADFDIAAFAAFLAGRADLGAKAVPRYVRVCRELPQTPSHKVVKRVLAREGWRTADPVYWRPDAQGAPGPAGPAWFQVLGGVDVVGIEAEFARHGRQHLLER